MSQDVLVYTSGPSRLCQRNMAQWQSCPRKVGTGGSPRPISHGVTHVGPQFRIEARFDSPFLPCDSSAPSSNEGRPRREFMRFRTTSSVALWEFCRFFGGPGNLRGISRIGTSTSRRASLAPLLRLLLGALGACWGLCLVSLSRSTMTVWVATDHGVHTRTKALHSRPLPGDRRRVVAKAPNAGQPTHRSRPPGGQQCPRAALLR